jgi:hypothetical protein
VKQLLIPPPRTWVLRPTDRIQFAAELPVTCLVGCETDHALDQGSHPSDVSCCRSGPHVELASTEDDKAYDDRAYLVAQIDYSPFSMDARQRVPHASIEIASCVWSAPLSPDDLMQVIDKLAGHVEALRAVHADLVEAVAAHQGGER